MRALENIPPRAPLPTNQFGWWLFHFWAFYTFEESFMSTVRQAAIKAIATAKYKLDRIDFKTTHVADLFGVNVFNEATQRPRLPKPIYKSLQKTIKQGAPLDPAIA